MPTKDPRVDAYIAKAPEFAKAILAHLRKIVHQGCGEVEETMKWGFPFFLHYGILCSMAAFKNHCSFGFWKRKLLFKETNGPGESEDGMGQFGRITTVSDLPSKKILIAYVRQAAKLNQDGVRVPTAPKSKQKKILTIPASFRAALKTNKQALAAFEKFSYTHKKEYVEWITEAKREETRAKRLATAIKWLSTGKTRHWKYMNCA